MGLHLLIVLVCLRVVTFIYPVPIHTKDILNHTCFHPWQPSHLKHEPTNLQRMSTHIHTHTYLLSSKSMRGSLFPLLPLRVKCQNHERAPISPISPILVVHALSSCQDMGHQNRENRDPFVVLALHQGKTMRGSLFPLFPLRVKCQNHERVSISPISLILVVHVLARWKDRHWK